MEKDLRLQAQHRDFQAQLSAEQMAREQVTNTLELMHQELEALKEAQSGPNPMDISLTDNADLNREHDKAEQEKRKLAEELEKTKTEYEQALASKIWTCYIKRYRAKHSATLIKSTSCSKQLPCTKKL